MSSKIHNSKKSLGKHRGLISSLMRWSVDLPWCPEGRTMRTLATRKVWLGLPSCTWPGHCHGSMGFLCVGPDLCVCELLSETGLDLEQSSHLKIFPGCEVLGGCHPLLDSKAKVSFLPVSQWGRNLCSLNKRFLTEVLREKGHSMQRPRGPGGLACGGSVC